MLPMKPDYKHGEKSSKTDYKYILTWPEAYGASFMVGHLDPLDLYLKAVLSPAASLPPTDHC